LTTRATATATASAPTPTPALLAGLAIGAERGFGRTGHAGRAGFVGHEVAVIGSVARDRAGVIDRAVVRRSGGGTGGLRPRPASALLLLPALSALSA
jgi:hypothetical protein